MLVDIDAVNALRLDLRARIAELSPSPQDALCALLVLASTSARELALDPCDLCVRVMSGFSEVYGVDLAELLRQTLSQAEAS